jgi:hypothetical protein
MNTATTEEATRVELGPAIAAILRDHADRLSADARGVTVDADDLDALQRRVTQLREPADINRLADDVAEWSSQDILQALRIHARPF